MKNIQIYAERIGKSVDPNTDQIQNQFEQLLSLLEEEGLDTSQPIVYGYDAVRRIFWFRNDAHGEMISLPLHHVKVWPEQHHSISVAF